METLARETSLGLRTVIRHIGKAEKSGWIQRKKNTRPFSDKRWKNNTYQAVIPKKIAKVVPEMHNLSKGSVTGADGSARECKKVVSEWHTNNKRIIKNKKDDEVGFSFLGEKTSSSEEYISKEQFDALKKNLKNSHSITNKKQKPSLEQRKAELKRQYEQIQADEDCGTLLTEGFELRPEISEYAWFIGAPDFDYIKSVFEKHKERLIRLKFKREDWVGLFKKCFDQDKISYPENYKVKNEMTATSS